MSQLKEMEERKIRRYKENRPHPDARLAEVIKTVATPGNVFSAGDLVWVWPHSSCTGTERKVRKVRHASESSIRTICESSVRYYELVRRKKSTAA